jgi:hypothetical protein
MTSTSIESFGHFLCAPRLLCQIFGLPPASHEQQMCRKAFADKVETFEARRVVRGIMIE